jgi:hypothetical protein
MRSVTAGSEPPRPRTEGKGGQPPRHSATFSHVEQPDRHPRRTILYAHYDALERNLGVLVRPERARSVITGRRHQRG